MFEALPPSIEHIRSGRLRALAVTSASRAEALPDVPAIAEVVNGYEASGWNGICAPKGVPDEIVRRLNEVINTALDDAGLKARLAGLGATTMAELPSGFDKLIIDETEEMGSSHQDGQHQNWISRLRRLEVVSRHIVAYVWDGALHAATVAESPQRNGFAILVILSVRRSAWRHSVSEPQLHAE